MAITQGMCSSFKEQLLKGEHDFDVDTFKIALYTSAATLSAATTIYTTSDEVVGAGYVAGGNTLTGTTVTLSGTTAFVDFSDSTWAVSTITARGALIYNASKANKAVAVLDFGADKTSTTGDFTVQFPINDASSAVIRLA
jgi:hypothetical protein